MGFFKDFKNDMKQAVNELMPGNDEMVSEYDDEDMVNTLDESVPADEAYVDTMSQKPAPAETAAADSGSEDIDLDDLDDIEIDEADLAEAETDGYTDDMNALADLLSGKTDLKTAAAKEPKAEGTDSAEESLPEPEPTVAESAEEPIAEETEAEPAIAPEEEAAGTAQTEAEAEEAPEAAKSAEVPEEEPVETVAEQEAEQKQEDTMDEDKVIEITTVKEIEKPESTATDTGAFVAPEEISDSTTYITKGTRIEGNLFTDGSVDIIGSVEGDVNCYGKLVVSGSINGKVNASEVYANAAKITGEITSTGSVKIGVGSVIVGNVDAQSAVVAGAVNGDLDIKGPVIVDSTAVIMGNIKSRSVQINNGAVIEGFCSQCYSDIDVKSFFA